MRYNLLTAALFGASTVSAVAIPSKQKDYSGEGVCKVQTVKVKLTSLDHFKGHSFPLLTPQQAIANLVDTLNKTSSGAEVDHNDSSFNTASLIDFNPAAPATTPAGGEGSFGGYPTGSPSGFVTKSGESGNAAPTASASGYWTTNAAGESTFYPQPTGSAGQGNGEEAPFPYPSGKGNGNFFGGDSKDGEKGHGGFGLPNTPIPTGGSGVNIPGIDIPDLPNLGDDAFGSIIPIISSALDHLTKSAGKPLQPIATPTGSNGASGSASISGSVSETGAPFPVPTGGNSTIPASSGSASASISASSGTASSSASSVSSSASSSVSSSASSSSSVSSTSSSSSSSASASASGCANPKVRPEWRDMGDSDKMAYSRAVKCLMDAPSKGVTGSTSRWGDLTAAHQQLQASIHGVGQFLPWHRYFIHVQETLLSTECNYNGPIPWWDETKDAGRFAQSPVFDSRYLGSARVKTSNGFGACVTDGIFADTELSIGPGMTNTEHCLSRAIDENLSKEVSNTFVAACNGQPAYAAMQDCQFTGPHAYGHDATGAVMSDVASSPGDPVFFLHHGFVDRNWAVWQAQAQGNLKAIGGFTTAGGRTPTTLQYVLNSMNILSSVEIEKVMDTKGEYLCYQYSY